MLKEEIKLPLSPKVKSTKFRGSPIYNLKVIKYLQKKFPEYCIIIPNIKKINNLDHEDVYLRWIQTKGKQGYFSITENYWDIFTRCENKRFILFPFGFTCKKNGGHANYFIYDKDHKSLERFEPYGKTKRDCTNPFDIDNKILKLFKENLGNDFVEKYYKPIDFLGEKSFQKFQEDEGEMNKKDPEGGFCAVWVAWYAELIMSNPNKDRKRLVKIALEKLNNNNNKSLTEYIRGFSMVIVNETKNL